MRQDKPIDLPPLELIATSPGGDGCWDYSFLTADGERCYITRTKLPENPYLVEFRGHRWRRPTLPEYITYA